MSKYIHKILVLFIIIILFLSMNKSYGEYTGILNYEIAKWHSSFSTSEATDENMNKWKSDLLEKLKKAFNYDGSTIREKMAMETQIHITKENDKTCTIRIRK